MLTICMMGGMGNQLFQWGIGQAFEARGIGVQYDVSQFDDDPGRRYLLSDLGLDLRTTKEGKLPTFEEGPLHYHSEVFALPTDAVLRGYWQTEKYYSPFVANLLRTTAFKNAKFSSDTLRVADKILRYGDRSCFVHLRRSDNAHPDHKGGIYDGMLTFDAPYYERAIALMHEKIHSEHFFIFSDDRFHIAAQAWHPDNSTIVAHNAPSFTDDGHRLYKTEIGHEYEDLWLMSLCHHGIMSNSSFCWWASWLGDKRDDRIVLAPDPWYFNAGAKQLDTSDLLPLRWKKVNSLP